jgi:hypothetical protein
MLDPQQIQKMSPKEVGKRLGYPPDWIAALARYKKEKGRYPAFINMELRLATLTPREDELYRLWLANPGQTEDFYTLQMKGKPSRKTVHNHGTKILHKLNCVNREQVQTFTLNGLLEAAIDGFDWCKFIF